MSAKKTPAQPNTTPRQPQPEEKARKEPVVFRAGRGEKAAQGRANGPTRRRVQPTGLRSRRTRRIVKQLDGRSPCVEPCPLCTTGR